MSDIKQTASLEVVIYGKKNLDEITKALKGANVEFDKLEVNSEQAAIATQKFGKSQVATSKIVIQGARSIAKAQEAITKTQQARLAGKDKGTANIKKLFSDVGAIKFSNLPGDIDPKLTQDVQKSYSKIIAAASAEGRENAIQELERKVFKLNKGVEKSLKGTAAKSAAIISQYSKQINDAEKELTNLQNTINNELDNRSKIAEVIGIKRIELQKKRQQEEFAAKEKAAQEQARAKERELKEEERLAKEELGKDEKIAKEKERKNRENIRKHVKQARQRLAMQDSFYKLIKQQQMNAMYQQPSEAEQLMASIKNREIQLKNEFKKDRIKLKADKERDRATEEYITSFLPRQLQPFFRRGGLFMQDMYRMKGTNLGPFGGIRGALGGRAGGGMGGGQEFQTSGPARVIAYDALRRLLTDVYSMVSKITGTFKDWIIEGVKFNDELVRAKTFFTSLGLLGIKGAAGEEITVAEASVSTNVKTKQAYEKSAQAAEEMMNRMMAVSALTGQDLGEIVSSARQSMTDLLNKVNKTSGGKTNAFLEDPKMFGNVAERMVKLASVLRMADPQNRKLGFHMVGLQELFSGSTGGKKDSGLQNVLSILRREGIKIEEGVAKDITKLVNKGDITGAMDLVEDALSRAGLGMVQLKNMLNSTLQPAIDGTIMFAKIFNRIFTKAFYDRTLLPFFRATLETFDAIFKNKDKMAALEKFGLQFSNAMTPIFMRLAEIFDFIQGGYNNAEAIKQVNNAISTIGGVMDVMLAFTELIAAFVAGIMGQADATQLKSLSEWMRSWTKDIFKLGQTVRGIAEKIQELDDRFGNMLKNIAIVVAIGLIFIGTFSTVAAVILGVVTPTLWLITGLRNLASALGIAKVATALFEATAGKLFKKAPIPAGMSPSIDLSRGAGKAAGEAAKKPGLVSRMMSGARALAPTVVGGLAAGAIGGLSMPVIIGIVAAVAGILAGMGYAYNNSKETDAKPSTPGRETKTPKVVSPSSLNDQKPKTVNHVNAPVTINIQQGAGQDSSALANKVSSAVSDSFRSIFSV